MDRNDNIIDDLNNQRVEMKSILDKYEYDRMILLKMINKYGRSMSENTKSNIQDIVCEVEEYIEYAKIFLNDIEREYKEALEYVS